MYKLFSLFIAVLIFSSCNKEIETTPCCTCDVLYSESGQNVLDCYMEGRPWSVCDSSNRIIKPRLNLFRDSGGGGDYWRFSNTKFSDGAEEVCFITFWWPEKGIIPFINVKGNSFPAGNISAWFNKSKKYKGWYQTDTSKYNYLEIIKFDTINHIVSGRFDCTLIEDNGGVDTMSIKITNGIFDFQYK